MMAFQVQVRLEDGLSDGQQELARYARTQACWREIAFVSEQMTGFLNDGINPLSVLTVAVLEDMGYTVDREAANAFTLPTGIEEAVSRRSGSRCAMTAPERRQVG